MRIGYAFGTTYGIVIPMTSTENPAAPVALSEANLTTGRRVTVANDVTRLFSTRIDCDHTEYVIEEILATASFADMHGDQIALECVECEEVADEYIYATDLASIEIDGKMTPCVALDVDGFGYVQRCGMFDVSLDWEAGSTTIAELKLATDDGDSYSIADLDQAAAEILIRKLQAFVDQASA